MDRLWGLVAAGVIWAWAGPAAAAALEGTLAMLPWMEVASRMAWTGGTALLLCGSGYLVVARISNPDPVEPWTLPALLAAVGALVLATSDPATGLPRAGSQEPASGWVLLTGGVTSALGILYFARVAGRHSRLVQALAALVAVVPLAALVSGPTWRPPFAFLLEAALPAVPLACGALIVFRRGRYRDGDLPLVLAALIAAATVVFRGARLDPQVACITCAPAFLGLIACLLVAMARRDADYARRRARVVESASDGVLVLADDGSILRSNPAARAMLGLDQTLSARTRQALPTSLQEALGNPAAGGEPRPLVETTVPSAAGEPRRVLEASLTSLGAGERLVVLRDIGPRRVLEERLAQSERLEALGQVAGGIAHDFNNLLQGVLGTAGDLRARGGLAPEVDRGLSRIERAAGRAAALTRQLLTFARGGRFEPRPTSLPSVIEEVVFLLGEDGRGAPAFRLKLPAGLPPVVADADGLLQVFDNLLRNARQAMEGRDGEVDVEAGTCVLHDDLARRLDVAPGPYVQVTVHDRGPGIDPTVTPRLFEPFFTTRAPGQGTGLGLAVAWRVIRQHGGSIRVDSQPGEGASFTVWLPVAVSGLPHAPAAGNPAVDEETAAPYRTTGAPGDGDPAKRPSASRLVSSAPIRPRSILFTDDEDVLRAFVAEALGQRGYQVTVASSGEAALGLLLDPEQTTGYDVLVVDLRMPGMDGLDVVEAARHRWPDLPAVLCSGFGPMERIDAFRALPRSHFLAKPFSVEALEEAIARVVEDEGPVFRIDEPGPWG